MLRFAPSPKCAFGAKRGEVKESIRLTPRLLLALRQRGPRTAALLSTADCSFREQSRLWTAVCHDRSELLPDATIADTAKRRIVLDALRQADYLGQTAQEAGPNTNNR